MKSKLIAILDDDPDILSTITEYLTNKGFDAKGFKDAESLFAFLGKEKPNLIILDIMLPGGVDGFEVCRKLKEKKRFSYIPIIIASGDNKEPDKVSGLELGADDYIVKPFSLNELNARIKAVLRRQARGDKEEEKRKHLKIGDRMTIDLQKYEVKIKDKKLELTPTEFKILEQLASRQGQVFTREQILEYLWGEEKIVVARTIDVHIRHLREKLGKAGSCIKNVRGIGYKFEA